MDGVEADDLAGQEEAEHLLASGGIHSEGLDGAGADRGDGVEGFALAEQVFAGLERADVFHQALQLVQRGLVVALVATGAGKGAGAAELELVPVIGGKQTGRGAQRHGFGWQRHFSSPF